jgi:acetolactate synthase small subunit
MPALAAGAIIALVGANIYLYIQIGQVRTDLAATQQSLTAQTAALSNLREAASVSTASASQHIDQLKQDLEASRAQERTLSSQAKAEAIAHTEQIARELEAAQAKQAQETKAEISGVRQSAEAANSKVADVSTDVGNVKSNLANTNSTLEKTIADLKSARGDLGVQSGLIATNATELAALRRLGERNYVDFKIAKPKKKEWTKLGDSGIQVQLIKADPKKNKYTLDVLADDKRTEKPDKGINEPVQFYTGKARQPYEIVVNQVQKDLIIGYLSIPKELAPR